MTRTTRTTAALMIAAIAGTLSSANAQSNDNHKDDGRSNQRGFIVQTIDATPRPGTIRGHSDFNAMISDGSDMYEVRIVNGSSTVRVNGEELGDDRYEILGDTLRIYDDKRVVLKEFVVGAPMTPRVGVASLPTPQRPRVMLGINLDSAPEALREHLGIDDDAIIVERVIEGLSAEKAGMREGDIIVSINGSRGVSASSLSEVLREFEPGETMRVTVIREGRAKEMKVELQPYDSGRLGVAAPAAPRTPTTRFFSSPGGNEQVIEIGPSGSTELFFGEQIHEMHDRTLRAVEQALRGHGIDAEDFEEIMEDIEDSLEDAFDEVDERFEDMFPGVDRAHELAVREAEAMRRKAEQAMRQAERQILEFKDGRLTLRAQREGLEQQKEALEQKLLSMAQQLEGRAGGMTDGLDDRLGMLEDRLDELDDRLERVLDSVERMTERLVDRLEQNED